jgi:hypothetical protein
VNTPREGQTLRAGDVVYFCDFHLNTARSVSDKPVYANTYVYEVHGKPRPMLVLDEIGEDKSGTKFFRVLKLSTKTSEFKHKLGYRHIGPILDDRASYADQTPYCLPENLVAGRVKKRIGRLLLAHVYKEIGATLAHTTQPLPLAPLT